MWKKNKIKWLLRILYGGGRKMLDKEIITFDNITREKKQSS